MPTLLRNLLPAMIVVMVANGITGCKKFLDEKPDAKLVIPSTLRDLQALMDDNTKINNADPVSMEVSADNYYLTTADWSGQSAVDRNMYRWNPDHIFDDFPTNDWYRLYRTVFSANTVLEHIDQVESGNGTLEWMNIKGQAYYHRAKCYLLLVSQWSKAYDSINSNMDMGVPIRLTTDFNQTTPRASVTATYQQVIDDLKLAIRLLPVAPVHVARPSKPTAYALMARTLLFMRKYKEAGLYADSCLQLKNQLMDFNTLNASATFPIAAYNVEVLIFNLIGSVPLSNTIAKIDSGLYNSYALNDLRKTVFFKNNNNGTFGFKGNYTGATTIFLGVAVDEVYLTRAECYARNGKISEAMADLNTLLQKRWKAGTFIPLNAVTAEDALALVLAERRKELLMRGIRWMDIKRLNKEGYNIILKRVLNNELIILPPNDNRYAMAIPEDVIAASGMPQNPR